MNKHNKKRERRGEMLQMNAHLIIQCDVTDKSDFLSILFYSTFVDNQEIMRVGSSFWQKGGFSDSNIWAGGERMAPFDQEVYINFV